MGQDPATFEAWSGPICRYRLMVYGIWTNYGIWYQLLKWFCEAGGLTWRSQVGANPIPAPQIWRYL